MAEAPKAKKFKDLSLFQRFFLIITSVALVPLMLVSLYLFHTQKLAKENTMDFHVQLVSFSADIVDDYMASLNRRLAFVRELERAPKEDPFELFKVLQQTLVTNPDFALLSVLDENGMERVKLADTKVLRESNPVSRADDPTFKEVQENGLVEISPVRDVKGLPVIVVVYPLTSGDFAYLMVNVSSLWRKLTGTDVGKTGKIVVSDQKGNILPGFKDYPPVKAEVLADWFGKDAAKEGDISDNMAGDKEPLVGAYKFVPAPKWYVLTLQPQAEAFLAAAKMKWQIIAFLSVISALAFVVAYFVASRITAPLLDLTGWALRVAKNDYSKAVTDPGWGELSTLASTCNHMMKELEAFHGLQIDRILEEKSKVETLVYTIPDGLVMANFNGELMYLNSPAMGVLGLDPKQVTPSSVFEVIRQDKLKKAVASALEKNQHVEDVEVEVEEPGSSEKKFFKTKATIVSTPEKKDVGVLLIMHDITFEKQMEKMKEGFFHSVAHDLRAPIFGVQGYLHLLEKRVKPGPIEQGYFKSMYASCDKLIALVKDILDVAQLESGSVKIDPSEIDVRTFAEKVHGAFVPVAIDRNLEMKIKLPEGDMGRAVCDERLFDRVLSNLISNALKFTPPPGWVQIEVTGWDDKSVSWDIADTGPGVPPDKIGRLFGKFQQLEGPQKSQGFGLGLSICKTVVEMHGGRIWVESEGVPGKGCHFRIVLPRMCPAENCKSDPGVKVGTYGGAAPAAAPAASGGH